MPSPKRVSTPLQRSPSAGSSSRASSGSWSAASSPPTSYRQNVTSSSSGTMYTVSPNKSSVGSDGIQFAGLSRSSSTGGSSSSQAARRRGSSSRRSPRAASPENLPIAESAMPPLDFVQAAYDFHQPDDPTYLSFRKGQLIRIVSKDASGWWNGELEGRHAWFPSNYVISLPASATMSRESSASSSAAPGSSDLDSTVWDRRASTTSSVASSSSDSYSAYGLPNASSNSTMQPLHPHGNLPDSRHRRTPAPTSPSHTQRRPSETVTPPRPPAPRKASGSFTRGTGAIVESITTAVSLLHSAVAAERISHFNPSTACVISSVRSVLSATDCLPKDSALLKLHPALARERKTILAELSKLVGQSRIASASTLPDGSSRTDEMELMLSLARRLLAGVKTFLAIAAESGIDLPDHADMSVTSADESDDDGGRDGRRAANVRTALTTAAPQDLDRTPTAAGADRARHAQKGLASGRRLMEALDRAATPVSELAPQPGACETDRPPEISVEIAQPLAAPLAFDDVGEAKAAHEELLVIISAFIGQVYSPSGTEDTAVVAQLLEVAHECLLRVLRILTIVDDLRPRLVESPAVAGLVSARGSLIDACSCLVAAAEKLGTSSVASPTCEQSDNDCRIQLLSGATGTLRTAASCVKVVAELAPSVDVAVVPATVKDSPEDASSLRRRGVNLMSIRDRLEHARAAAASHRALTSVAPGDRSSVGSLSIASTSRSESGEDLTIRATLPPWSEAVGGEDFQDPMAESERSSRPASTSRAESIGTEASLSLSTQTASTDVTLASPRCSTDSSRPARQPVVRSVSSESFDGQSATAEHLKEATPTPSLASAPTSTLPQRARASTLANSPKTNLKLSDPPLDLPTPRPESSHGRFWILGHDYDPTDLALAPDGNLIGASLPALVEKLTPHDTAIVDPALLDMFFLCFRLFASPAELFSTLVQRFRMEGPSAASARPDEYAAYMQNKIAPVRIRVYGFLKLWLDAHWRPEADADILPDLETFAGGLLKDVMPSVAPRLLHAVRIRSQPSSPEQRSVALSMGALLHKAKSTDRLWSGIPRWEGGAPDQTLPPTPQLARSLFQALRNQTTAVAVTDFDPLELARQLTVMESKLFNAVKAQDVLDSVRRSSPSLKAMSNFNTHLTSLVSDTILTERDIKKRSAILKFFIKLANRLLDLRNFSSAFAVVASLNGSSIVRLKKTWDALSSKAKLSIAALRDLFDSSRNHANYRARLRASDPPALPFLGIILSDVTFCNDGNQNTRRSPLAPDKQLINLSKFNALWRIVSDMRRYQVPFSLAEVPEVQIFLSKVFAEKESTSIENLYRKSLSVEPRTTTTSATHP